MQDSAFQIPFLGEELAWSKISQVIAEVHAASLRVLIRSTSCFWCLPEATGTLWCSIFTWNFQGLHYVEKLRSEYSALPIIALYTPIVPELDAKAATSGASRSLVLDDLSA
jgi:hypothetical protein